MRLRDILTRRASSGDIPKGFDPHCLGCGVKNDGITSAHGTEDQPNEGSLMMCLNCGFLSIFGKVGYIQPTEKEYEAMLDDPGVVQMLMVRAFMAAKGEVRQR